MVLPDEILLILLFVLPGLFSIYIRSGINDLPKKKEEWQARLYFIIFSVVSWYTFYLVTLFIDWASQKYTQTHILPISVSLKSLTESYLGIPVLFWVLIISGLLGAVVGRLDNTEIHDKIFGLARTKLGLNPENRKDLWTRIIVSRKPFIAHIAFNDGRDIWGITRSASSNIENKSLYILPIDENSAPNFKASLPQIQGLFVDLENGYSIEIFDASDFQQNYLKYRKQEAM